MNDAFAVKAAVLDEDRRGVLAGHHTAGDEQVRDVRLERVWIERRHAAIVERDAGTCERRVVGMVTELKREA